MIDLPEIVQTSDQLTAYIHVTIPRHEIASVMGPGISELMTTVGAQGIAITGPWFTRHRRMDPGVFDFEISVPVSAPVTPSGRVEPGVLPGMRVARTVHHGAYEGLAAAWGELDAWMGVNEHTPGPGLWEVYLAGPESGPDTETWRTELNHPIADRPAATNDAPMRPRDLVRAWVEAFNRGDVEALAGFYAADAINHQVALEPVEGRDAIRTMFAEGFAAAEMVCIVENLFEDGAWAILEWSDPKGLRGCGFFHVVDGRIAFQRGYWDRLSFHRLHGIPLSGPS